MILQILVFCIVVSWFQVIRIFKSEMVGYDFEAQCAYFSVTLSLDIGLIVSFLYFLVGS